MIRGVKRFFKLFWTHLVVAKRNFAEFLKTVCRYYHNLSFLKADQLLLWGYFFKSPFRMSKRFLLNKGEKEVHTYGETPLSSMERIAEKCEIKREDTVFELGCGRGRSCFWLDAFVGCKVIGIDWVPEFIRKAQKVKQLCHLDNLDFRCEDMFESDFAGATVIYLYGTCLRDDQIIRLTEILAKAPKGTRIITVSYPLCDYAKEANFEIMKLFPLEYTWGEADVYLQVLRGKGCLQA